VKECVVQRWFVLLCLSFVVVMFFGVSASACSCEKVGSPCRALEGASAVFVGTVTAIKEGVRKQKPDGEVDFTPRLITFSVEQRILGDVNEEAEVATGLNLNDCGFPFVRRTSYLVYAYSGEKDERLYTNSCTRTKRAANASEDFQFLRGLASSPGVNISGKVERQLPYAGTLGQHPNVPMEGTRLTIEGAGQTKEVRTDAQGRFSLNSLLPGELKLKLHLPDELAVYKPERLLKFKGGGCASEGFYVVDNGRITGRVFDAEGNPVTGIGVVVLGTTGGSSSWYAKTDEEGRYKIAPLPLGQYFLGVNVRGLPRSIEVAELPKDYVCPNCRFIVEMHRADEMTGVYPRVFYPGVFQTSKAELISVSVGQELRDVDLRLPPRPAEGVVKGRVALADGSPAAGAQVTYREVTHEDLIVINYGVRTDEKGEFSFKVYRGGRYMVQADYEPSDKKYAGMLGLSEHLSVTVTKPEETITLIIKKFMR
jgi:carboxypeptidase family protein